MSNTSRRKGHAYENEIAALFREAGYPNAGRHLEYQADEANGVDLKNTGPFRVQCKRHKTYAPLSILATIQTGEGGIPVLVTKADRQPDLVALPLVDFLAMLRRLNGPQTQDGGV